MSVNRAVHTWGGGLVLAVSAAQLWAQSGDWQTWTRQASELQRMGRLEEAGAALQKALDATKHNDGSECGRQLVHTRSSESGCATGDEPEQRIAIALNRLGMLQQQRGELLEARQSYARALMIWETATGDSDAGLLPMLNNLGSLCLETGQYTQADRYLERARTIGAADRSTPSTPDRAVSLHNSAILRTKQRKYGEAARFAEQALERLARSGETSSLRADILNTLAVTYERNGRVAAAVPVLEEAVATMEGRSERARLAILLNNLGEVQKSSKDYRGAESSLRRAAAIAASDPQAHPRLRAILLNYAEVLRSLRRKGEAKRVERQARELRRQTGQTSPLRHTIEWTDLLPESK